MHGACGRCGAGEVRCKGLCARCYFADRYDPARQNGLPGAEARALERDWDTHALTMVLMAERPRPGRQGGSWTAEAACRAHRGLPWEGRRITAEMRTICDGCAVRAECLAEALRDRRIDGIWAGTTPAERRRLRHVACDVGA